MALRATLAVAMDGSPQNDGSSSVDIRCGLVGPGRTRNGLAPFLARDLEAAGARVVAAAGRDPDRTAAACADLGARLGHDVAAAASVTALIEDHRLDALVIAAPIPAHLPALRAALDAGVAVLCEKPLVAPEEHDAVEPLVAAFRQRGQLLMENCQLPFVLAPAFDGVRPGLRQQPVERIEMHMAPSGQGRAMLEDSVSHFVSVVQGLLPGASADAVQRVAVRVPLAAGETLATAREARVDLDLDSPFAPVAASLYLLQRVEQPRPQWFGLNGVRVERRIDMADYSMRYCGLDAGGVERCVSVQDPLAALTQAFVAAIREPDLDRNRAAADAVLERARLYRALLDGWQHADPEHAGPRHG